MSNKNAHVLVGVTSVVEISSVAACSIPQRQVQSQILEIVQDQCLTQLVNIHTREEKTLDLLFTNSPSPVNRFKGISPIGKYILSITLRLSGFNKPRERFFSINEQIWMVFVAI